MGGLYEANLAINEVCPPLLDGPQKEKTGKLLMLLAAHTEGGMYLDVCLLVGVDFATC